MKVEVSTDLIPVIHVGSYWSNAGLYEHYVTSREIIEQSILACAPDVVHDALCEVSPDIAISDFSVYMPQYYNYGDDEFNFTITIPDDEYQRLYDECIDDPKFPEFLKKNYSSYDGFISFLANDTSEFDAQEDYKKLSQLICFQYFKDGKKLQESYDYDYYEALDEWLVINCPPYDEDVGSNGETYVYINYDWKNGKDCYIVSTDDDEEVAVFPVEGDTIDATWDAYNKAYNYCCNELGIS